MSVVVCFGSQFQGLPHSTLEKIAPVTIAMVMKMIPILAEASATSSHRSSRLYRYKTLAISVIVNERNEMIEDGKWKKSMRYSVNPTAFSGRMKKMLYMPLPTKR